jgi:hypothetical protein
VAADDSLPAPDLSRFGSFLFGRFVYPARHISCWIGIVISTMMLRCIGNLVFFVVWPGSDRVLVSKRALKDKHCVY